MRPGNLARAALSLMILAGCSGGEAPTSVPNAPEEFVFVGTVREIRDEVPVDGLFVITIDLDTGTVVEEPIAGLGGWQVPPPLTEDRQALLETIHRLQVGDRVRAEGTHDGEYPGIHRLTVLPGPWPGNA